MRWNRNCSTPRWNECLQTASLLDYGQELILFVCMFACLFACLFGFVRACVRVCSVVVFYLFCCCCFYLRFVVLVVSCFVVVGLFCFVCAFSLKKTFALIK